MLPRGSLPCNQHSSVEGVLLTLGGFSTFQFWAGFVILSPEIPASMIAMLPVFVGADRAIPNHFQNLTQPENDIYYWSIARHRITQFETVVQEWGLYDGLAWVTEMFTSVFMTGMMLGAFTASQLADRLTYIYIFIFILSLSENCYFQILLDLGERKSIFY